MAKNPTYVKLINTQRWRRLRAAALTAHPFCERCEKEGRLTVATEVHHATPCESVPTEALMESLMYDPANLVCVCHECHKRYHRELHSGTREVHKQRDRARLEAFARAVGLCQGGVKRY